MAGSSKVPFLKSLRARFALVIASVASFAILVIFMVFSSRFETFLNSGIKEELTGNAEKAADAVGATVKTQVGQLTTFAAPLLLADPAKQKVSFSAFLQGFNEFLTLSTYRFDPVRNEITSSVTSDLADFQKQDALFQGGDSIGMHRTLLELEMRELEQFARNESLAGSLQPSYRFVSLARESRLPVFTILVRYPPEKEGSKEFSLVATSIWLTSLMVALPKTAAVETSIVDGSGIVVGSTVVRDVLAARSYGDLPVVRAALVSVQPSGFYERLGEWKIAARLPPALRDLLPKNQSFVYQGKRRLEWVGAFARVQKQGIGMDRHWVIVQKRSDAVFGVLKKSKLDTILAALFVLIGAVAVGVIWAGESTVQLGKVYRATGEIASGKFDTRIEGQSEDEIGQIAGAVNQMAADLKEQVELKAEKGRLLAEANTARTVQETFFPAGTISVRNLKMTGSYQPATECGGDLWGHFTVRPGVELVYIADAMGHGASAAIMTAMAYTACNLISDIIKDAAIFHDSPAQLLNRMNTVIFGAVKGKISMTCFAVLYDFNKGQMVFSNAGHNFPFVMFPVQGEAARPAIPQSLSLSGNPLGVDDASVFTDKTRPILAGERLVLFTDGLIECRSPGGQMWGRKALSSTMQSSNKANSVEELRDAIVGKAFGFFANVPLADDVTLVVAEVDSNWVAGNNGLVSESQPGPVEVGTIDLAVA